MYKNILRIPVTLYGNSRRKERRKEGKAGRRRRERKRKQGSFHSEAFRIIVSKSCKNSYAKDAIRFQLLYRGRGWGYSSDGKMLA